MAKKKTPKKKMLSEFDSSYKKGIEIGKKNFEKLLKAKDTPGKKMTYRNTSASIKKNPKPYYVKDNMLWIMWDEPMRNKFCYVPWRGYEPNK